ncbi:MAG TPA: GNAT family N-acetyltransferase, partial [Tepidisphaeraceae bacterium]|nr:GNAT family N-acetyltransferase [Tepidisphaeraceae bacterium]
FREHLLFANEQIRTISRVVVHPQFRSIGLSSVLVRCLIQQCSTRYVEALAQMGRAHPFFEKAGMRRIDPVNEKTPVYFIYDRASSVPRTPACG